MKLHSDWARRASVALILLYLGSANAGAAQQDGQPDAQFQETLAVCANLDMYAEFAASQRDQSIPADAAASLITASIQKNMKLPEAKLRPFTVTVTDLYRRVYADRSLKRGMFDDVILASCSTYNGYQIDRAKLRQEFSGYVQSVFNPLTRVPVCVKAAETAANVGAAREKGIGRTEILEIARKGLGNDTRTLASLPVLVDEVYDNGEIQLGTLYLYYLRNCEGQKANYQLPPLAELVPAAKQCQIEPDKEKRTDCLSKLFAIDSVAARER